MFDCTLAVGWVGDDRRQYDDRTCEQQALVHLRANNIGPLQGTQSDGNSVSERKYVSRGASLLEGGDLLVLEVLGPVEGRRAVVRQQLARELGVHAVGKRLSLQA
jgi:hypothetical protein